MRFALISTLTIAAVTLTAAGPSFANASDQEPFGALQWGNQSVRGTLVPPPVSDHSPSVAFVEKVADLSHPDLSDSSRIRSGNGQASGPHATAVLSIAAALRNGVGIEGLWPGMRSISLGSSLSCDGSARAIREAIRSNARVVNMSYTGNSCVPHRLALEEAVAANLVLVAATGNSGDARSQLFPASSQHVVGVGSFGRGGQPSSINQPGSVIDLLAPGEGIAAAVPISTQQTLLPAGWDYVNGTSFAAPFVASAAAWIAALRPELTADQIVELLLRTASPVDSNSTWPHPIGGWGKLTLSSALNTRAPRPDQFEPNDSIQTSRRKLARQVRGIDPLALRPGDRFSATVRANQDERDIYRLRLRRGEEVRLKVASNSGPLTLRILHGHAGSDLSARPLLKRLPISRRRSATVELKAEGLRTRSAYISLAATGSPRRFATPYRIQINRVRTDRKTTSK